MSFTELHLHDYYSALDGLNSPEEYMKRANELGMTHLPQTNHGTLAGHREFQRAAKGAGIIPILGLEAYISPTDRFDRRAQAKRQDGTSVYNHIILLAEDEVGLRTLNRLSQTAWEEGYYFKPRMDTDLLAQDNEGIIVLSGCLSGLVSKAIEADNMEEALAIASKYKEIFADRYFIEVQGHNPPKINVGLLEVADKLDIKPVATSDCHYARKEDLWLEEAMLILSTNPKPNFQADLARSQKMDILERLNYLYPDRRMSFVEFELFLRDRASHVELFEKQGIFRTDIYDNTNEIATRIGDYPYYQGLDLLPNPDRSVDPDVLLRRKVEHGAKKRGTFGLPEHDKRREEELQVIIDKGYSEYILIVADVIQWAKDHGIPVGPGRGSAAGSLVCFDLSITDVDPIKHNLLFFRFIDPARDDFPDIDMDFGDKRRGEVKQYIINKYGYVAAIATFNTFQGKSSLKDAGRVFRVPVAEVNAATKNNDAPPNVDFFEHFVHTPQGAAFKKKWPEVVDLAQRLHGKLRGGGMHAAGLVVSKEPINKYAPIETAKDPQNPNGPRVQYVALDMNECADVGFIKFDFLGLKAMTVVHDALELIAARHGKKINLYNIDFEDQKVYDMLSEGYTKGVFQCEAVPYTNLILKMGGVHSFAELAASNALVRPGAMNTIGAEYIERKNGKPFNYIHKDTKWFTDETYGEVLYQEQVMLMMTEIAGMDMSTANEVRKIIGKKKDPVLFEPYRVEFIEGATKKINQRAAEKMWESFLAHAGYSFNKSHAVAYSMISYWTAWLKFYYPLEFMAATLRNEEDGDSITDYLIETRRLGIRVLLPHVNKSRLKISIDDGAIRLGLTNIKYIRDKVGQALISHRPYHSYQHLADIAAQKGSGISSRTLMALNAIGAATFQDNPRKGNERDNFYEFLKIPAFEQKELEPKVKYKFRDLDEYIEKGVFSVLAMVRGIKRGEGWARVEVVDETGTAGIFTNPDTPIESGQMYAMLVADNRVVRYLTMDELYNRESTEYSKYLYDEIPPLRDGEYRTIAFRTHVTKANKKMAYTVLMNPDGTLLPVMVFPNDYRKMFVRLQAGNTNKLQLAETDSGALFVKELL